MIERATAATALVRLLRRVKRYYARLTSTERAPSGSGR
jgi:hypothetical protein